MINNIKNQAKHQQTEMIFDCNQSIVRLEYGNNLREPTILKDL